jgi:hypothetical protein
VLRRNEDHVNTRDGLATLTPGAEVSVRLVKDPRPEVVYPAVVLSDDGDHVVLRAPWFGPADVDAGFVRYERGDIWTEHFWRSRWFSVKEIRTVAGELKGWYCDVARPAVVRDGTIVVDDLELDVWLSGDRSTVLRLDEDEFIASGLAEREPETAVAALRAWDELEQVARGDGGFADLLAW